MLNKKLLGGSSGLPQDDNFENVTLLLNGDGTNGGQNNTFVDSSTNNFTITRNGNTTQGSFSPYGDRWSIYSDGSGDYLSISDSASFPSGTTEFCYEAWFYPTANTNSALFAKGGDNGYYEQVGVYYTSGNLICYFANSSNVYIVNAVNFGTPTVGQWNHIAVYRSGNNFYGSLNGTVTSLGTSSASIVDNAAAFVVSGYSSPNPVALPVTGYISNLRLVTGSAVYGASNFTPPTTPLTAISGTQLLMCQANRFIDSSSNAFSITVGGNPSVQRFSPFEPSAPYSTSVIGGSGYFDGSGDYLSVASQTALGMGSGDFTYEAWVYVNETVPTNAVRGLFDSRISGATGCGIYTSADSGNTAKLVYTTNSAIAASSTNTIPSFAWSHIAVTRSGTTVRGFINGVLEFTYTDSRTFASSAGTFVGADVNATVFNGFITDARILKGTAQYTAAFTTNTAPLTAITNTSLLCNTTNASIADLAMQNNLETVGNAQVSTSVKKFGTGSLYFDGTSDCLQSAPSEGMRMGSGDFTIECWVYFNTLDANTTVMRLAAGNGTDGILFCHATNGVYITSNGSSWDIINGSAFTGITTGVWTHLALTRSGSTFRGFVNGTVVFTVTSSASIYQSSPLARIGAANSGGAVAMNGYVDDIRITKGVARYTANFTVPASAHPTF